jgi:multidrug resistance efflux pump
MARAKVAAAEAQLDQAKDRLERRRIVAPVNATVLWSRYRVGESYSPQKQGLFVLGDLTRYQIRVEVDELDVSRVALDAFARVRLDSAQAPIAEGRVIAVSPRMGRKSLSTESPNARGDTRIREVLVEIPAKAPLLPGLRVWVELNPAPAP